MIAVVQRVDKASVKVNDKIRVSNFVGGTDKARQIKKLEAAQMSISL